MLKQVPGLIVLPQTQKKENDKMNVPMSIHWQNFMYMAHICVHETAKKNDPNMFCLGAVEKHFYENIFEKEKRKHIPVGPSGPF